jgi:alpha-mannosidase
VTEESGYFKIETSTAISRLSRASGVIGEYYDKTRRRSFVAYGTPKHLSHCPTTRQDLGLNLFQIIDESPNDMSAWLINDVVREENLLRGANVELVETGPVFARFRVTHRFRASRIDEEVIYYNDYPRVDFEAAVDWREQGGPEQGVPQLRVSFAGHHSRSVARFEGPFCITERPADGQEQPTQRWVDASGRESGFALLNDGRYGCDVLGSRIRLTLLRNAYWPDEESDNGRHVTRFAFMPHGPRMAAAELTRQGMAYNRQPLTMLTGSRATPPLGDLTIKGADAVVCTCLRKAEHSGALILRLFESNGKKATIRFRLNRGIRSAQEVNFLERPLRKTRVSSGWASASFRPHEVKTFLLTTDG